MNQLFARWLPCATLATWSAILIYYFFSGRLNDLLTPPFRPYVLAAGIVLALMAAVFLAAPVDAACCAATDCGHSFFRLPVGKILTFLVLLIPISLSALVSPDSFSRAMLENRTVLTNASSLNATKRPPSPPPANTAPAAAPAQDYLRRNPEGYILAEVLDLLYAAQDNELRKDFEGKKVELVGQLMPEKSTPDGKRFKAVRMFMTCCAADARPVATLVEADPLPDIPEMTWVKITGTSTFPIENGRRVTLIKAEKVEKTSPPNESMIY